MQAKTFTKNISFFGKAFFSKESFAIKGLNEVGKVIRGSKVLIMGLTYKENVPDTRESPVKDMVKELKEEEIKKVVQGILNVILKHDTFREIFKMWVTS